MDANYISKKELLEMYGISYGALYRWKRMGLIPEDWFIRRSTSTGQETFFRREQIIPRMDQITERGASLENLAAELNHRASPAPEPRAELLIQDAYGLHRYPLEALESVRLALGEEQTELLEQLKGAIRHG
jgi:DNA-binding transcriptional MerR regulator